MLAGDLNRCFDFPCVDVRHAGNCIPKPPARKDRVGVMMISTAPHTDRTQSTDPNADSLIRPETLEAFRAAGYDVATVEDVRSLGVYVTTAVKCPKLGYGLKSETIANCSHILESEILMLPNLRSILLMGISAITAINTIAVRRGGDPVIPSGSAYKVRGHEYHLGTIALFPSYPETGNQLSVEDDRNETIAVDIRNAIQVAGGPVSRSPQSRPTQEPTHSPESQPRGVPGRSAGSSSAAD